jgi:LysM repeat protein
MSINPEHDDHSEWDAWPLGGLKPSRLATGAVSPVNRLAQRESHEHSRMTRNLLATMPVLLVGSLALATLNLGGTTEAASKKPLDPQSDTADLSKAVRDAVAASASSKPADPTPSGEMTIEAASVPAHYTVKHGDTISGIAGRYHLATATLLALNGLGWKSLIFPGQVLKLTKTKAVAPKPPVVKTPPVSTPPATPPSTPAAPTSSTNYTIKSGDTITSIAKKFAVTVSAILKANGLTTSSIIYAGRTLIIPGATSTTPAQVGSSTTPLSPTMKTNALTIISVGRKLGVPDYGIVIALAAAAQESGLQNLSGGDKDSIGLFQQRPSTGWGTKAQLENTTYAAELFYGGPSNPNKGKTRGLLDIKNWQSMTVTQAAQAVEISGHPDAYAKWEASARAWLAQLG